MISKILIANRGEIACRIIKTCEKIKIKSVAIFADPDKNCLFVKNATESYRLEGISVQETYLNIDKIISIAKKANVDAIHPGYGFLSENSEFADKVVKAGIKFIGPSSEAILAMGLKSRAKELMQKALVQILPSYSYNPDDASSLENIKYPVLIKAAAGGGGKGMQIVKNAKDLPYAISTAKREAMKYFANDELIIEKYLSNPRHVEVQIMFDNHGNGVYLFERDCSLQRRYQKIIEEAPAPNINSDLRAKLGEQALMAGRAVNYTGAGTIEFLLDGDDFYFMEMNTRLQVEHPVTEFITGLDLVELQIKIADGEQLPVKQADLKIHGHAIEARLYAEDVVNNFLPATGVIKYLNFNDNLDNKKNKIRVDSGIKINDEISIYYDPMLAKIIAHGEDRNEAVFNLNAALNNIHLIGVKNNLAFLSACLQQEEFVSAKLSTNFIDNNITSLIQSTTAIETADSLWLTAGLYYNFCADHNPGLLDRDDPWSKYYNWRNCQSDMICFDLICSNDNYSDKDSISKNISIEYLNTRQCNVSIDGGSKYYCSNILITQINHNVVEIGFDARFFEENIQRVSNKIIKIDDKLNVFYCGRQFVFSDKATAVLDSAVQGKNSLVAPMPGTIIAINVENGSKVKEGDALMILEAMKMEHTISAPSTGIVKTINFKQGEQVSLGAELLVME